MKYIEHIDENNRPLYSVNFLLAEFEEIADLKRDQQIMNNRVSCHVFETGDFKTRPYYKQISTCLTMFDAHDTNKPG